MTFQKLAPHEWPEVDRRLWAQMTARGSVFDDAGPLAHLKPATIRNCTVVYGRWLSWLRSSTPGALHESPPDRMTATRVSAWMKEIALLAPYSRVMFLDELIRVFRAMAPDRDAGPLRRIRKVHHDLARSDHGSRKQGRIPCTLDIISAGLDLGTAGVEGAASAFERARRLRDAAMVVFLAMHPIRRKNFVELEIGRSMMLTAQSLRIVLSCEDTKTCTPYEAEIQEPAAGLLRRYLADARPFFLARAPYEHRRLWVADTGLPYTYGYIGTRIPMLGQRLLGVKVAMHFFRDAVATTFARSSPELARGTRAILGHGSFRTTERHYNQAKAIEAGRDYGSIIRKLTPAKSMARTNRGSDG